MICQVLENLKAKYMIGLYIYIYIYIYDDDASGALFLRWPRSEGIIRFNAPFHCSVVTEVEQWFIKVSIKWLSVNA